MRTQRFVVTLAIAGALLAPMAAQDVEVALQRAIEKETVSGDLKAAIQAYKKIAANANGNRAVAARALVHMAECYQQLGDAEARKVYERVVRDYADQQGAVQMARAGLNRGAAPVTVQTASRHVLTLPPGGDLFGAVSRDGRYLPFTDWSRKGDLYLHDFRTGTERRLTDTASDVPGGAGEFAEECAFSKDGKQLAYSWHDGKRYDLRVMDLKGSGVPQYRRLFAAADVEWIGPYDWSPDGKWLAVALHRPDKTYQLGLITVPDGTLTILKTLEVRQFPRMFFSPDSRFLAFDTKSRATSKRDIFVLSMADQREIPAVVNPNDDSLLGWSPDGNRLLFASDRTGSNAVWLLRFEEGKPVGEPEFVRPVEMSWPLGVTATGSLYTANNSGTGVSDIKMARFDFGSGKFLSMPVQAVSEYVGSNHQPMISPDGKYLSYVSWRGAAGTEKVLCIRSLETGHVQELRPKLSNYGQGWAPDGKSLIASASDFKGRQGMYWIDRQTGEISPFLLAQTGEALTLPQWSADGKKIYFRRIVGRESSFVERDLASGNEREVVPRGRLLGALMSPDRLHVAVPVEDTDRKGTAMMLYPAGGGTPRELMRTTRPDQLSVLVWARDSRALLLRKGRPREHNEVWRVPMDGSQAQKLDLNVDNIIGPLGAYPHGEQVVMEVVGTRHPVEVWVLENFLPEASARK